MENVSCAKDVYLRHVVDNANAKNVGKMIAMGVALAGNVEQIIVQEIVIALNALKQIVQDCVNVSSAT